MKTLSFSREKIIVLQINVKLFQRWFYPPTVQHNATYLRKRSNLASLPLKRRYQAILLCHCVTVAQRKLYRHISLKASSSFPWIPS